MTAQSKDAGPDDAAARENKRYIDLAAAAFFLAIVGNTQLLNAQPALLADIMAGKPAAQTARLVGFAGTAGSLVEFLSGPAVGRLSDSVGRKPFILGGLAGTLAANLLVLRFPNWLTGILASGVVTAGTMTMAINTLRIGLSDKLQGKDLGVAHAKVGIMAGLGVIVAPLVASRVTARFGNRGAYGAAAAFHAANIALLSVMLKETLKPDKVKPMNWADANPVSFMRLLTTNSRLTKLTLVLGLQCVAEPRFVLSYAGLLWREKHKYGPGTIGRLVSMFGVIYIIGAAMAKKRMAKVGIQQHVKESNLSNLLSFLCWSMFHNEVGTVLSFLLMIPGIRKRDGLEVMITDIGTEQGWGKGETSGMMNNFKSVSAIAAPMLMSQAYAYTSAPPRSFHGSPMLVGALFTLLSDALYRSIPA